MAATCRCQISLQIFQRCISDIIWLFWGMQLLYFARSQNAFEWSPEKFQNNQVVWLPQSSNSQSIFCLIKMLLPNLGDYYLYPRYMALKIWLKLLRILLQNIRQPFNFCRPSGQGLKFSSLYMPQTTTKGTCTTDWILSGIAWDIIRMQLGTCFNMTTLGHTDRRVWVY